MNKTALLVIMVMMLLPLAVWAQCGSCSSHETKSSVKESTTSVTLPGYNKSVNLPDGMYFKYSFNKKPKIGTSILKVSVYDKKGRLSDDYAVYADADMPSMKGAHSTGEVKMKANKKGELLLPINFVMAGVWQVDLKFHKDGKQVFCGCFEVKI